MLSRQFFCGEWEKEDDFADFARYAGLRSCRDAEGFPLHFVRDLVK